MPKQARAAGIIDWHTHREPGMTHKRTTGAQRGGCDGDDGLPSHANPVPDGRELFMQVSWHEGISISILRCPQVEEGGAQAGGHRGVVQVLQKVAHYPYSPRGTSDTVRIQAFEAVADTGKYLPCIRGPLLLGRSGQDKDTGKAMTLMNCVMHLHEAEMAGRHNSITWRRRRACVGTPCMRGRGISIWCA